MFTLKNSNLDRKSLMLMLKKSQYLVTACKSFNSNRQHQHFLSNRRVTPPLDFFYRFYENLEFYSEIREIKHDFASSNLI